MANILIVEDEKSINDLVLMNLKLVGHVCRQAYDANEALSILKSWHPDLVVLDVMLPYVSGFSLMEQKAFGELPVIFLTAKDSVIDRVKGLNLGADDYIVKPFEAIELIARIEAVLRRVAPAEAERIFTIGSTVVYLDRRTVTTDGIPMELTNQEFELLETLINNRNIALSREKLLNLAWGYHYMGDSRTVDVHITKLRKKLKLEPFIKTVFKLGYRLEV